MCNRLNAYIVPEAAVHAFLTFLFVINGYWLTILLNLPLVAYNAKKYVYTPATTHSTRGLSNHIVEYSKTSIFLTRQRSSGNSTSTRR